MEESPLLQVQNLQINLQKGKRAYPVVSEVSFTVNKGETRALVGESGCGKTLTSLSIMQILPDVATIVSPSEIVYHGHSLLSYSEKQMRAVRGKQIAMIFQDPMSALNPVYTIGWQLIEVLDQHMRLTDEETDERIITVLEEVGIANPQELLDVYPHQISGGMKQRVMIAMALLCEPDLLIADEPTTALDVTIQAQILDLIRELQQKKGMAVLLITHDMGVVAEMADHVSIMYAGQVVEEGTVHEVFDHPQHPYTQGLFRSTIDPESPKGSLHPIRGMVPPFTNWPTGCRFHPRCPYAMPKCRSNEVPFFTPQPPLKQKAKCWLHDGTEESRQKKEGVSVDV